MSDIRKLLSQLGAEARKAGGGEEDEVITCASQEEADEHSRANPERPGTRRLYIIMPWLADL